MGRAAGCAKWRWLSVGSVFAALAWLAVSSLFSWYLGNFANYNATYGALGAVVGLMMWMWLSTIVVLVGAELNSEIEHQTARDSTVGPARPLGVRGAVMADTVGAALAVATAVRRHRAATRACRARRLPPQRRRVTVTACDAASIGHGNKVAGREGTSMRSARALAGRRFRDRDRCRRSAARANAGGRHHAPDHAGGADRGRRRRRRHRPAARREAAGAAQAAGRGREPGRRGRRGRCRHVAKAAPDGRTLLLIDISAVLHKWLHKNVPFDVIADFAPVCAGRDHAAAAVRASFVSAPTTSKELIAHAKANPGKVSVGTPGVGSPHHLALLMMNCAAKIDITHVPYRGTAPALNDLLGGQIPLIWATPNAVMPHRRSRQGEGARHRVGAAHRRAAAGADHRGERAAGLRCRRSGSASRRRPRRRRDIVERLGKEIGEITDAPGRAGADGAARVTISGYRRTARRLRDLIATDHKRYGEVIRDAGIAPN